MVGLNLQCKEQSLNSESFLAAVRTPHSPAEVERLQEFVAVETERLKTRGVSGADQQRLASLDVVMTTIVKQLQGETVRSDESVRINLHNLCSSFLCLEKRMD